MANILEAAGFFWRYNLKRTKTPDLLADTVSGILTIEANGLARLQLNGFISSPIDASASLFHPNQPLDEDFCIQGVLKGVSQMVLLCRLQRDGTSLSKVGISFENFAAKDCIVSDHGLDRPLHPRGFNRLMIDLTGLEEWLGSSSIELQKRRGGLSAVYRKPPTLTYPLPAASLSLSRTLVAPFVGSVPTLSRHVELRELFFFILSTPASRTISELREDFHLFEDFLLMLVGSEVSLNWPRLKNRSGVAGTFYFHRETPEVRTLSWMECWTSFSRIKDDFGHLYLAYAKKRDEFGPGMALYLGTRRAKKMYWENRFVNLIWGLESMHRRKPASPTNLDAKIARILSRFEKGEDAQTAKDDKWLQRILEHAGEPNLETRLIETFKVLPLGISEASLQAFCAECAHVRNDISHYGGQRHDGNYQEFINRLAVLEQTLECLYHALILHEIGIPASMLIGWILGGPSSYGYRKLFQAVGLVWSLPAPEPTPS